MPEYNSAPEATAVQAGDEAMMMRGGELYQLPVALVRNIELGHAEITSNFTRNATSYTDVTGLQTTVTVGDRPVMLRFWALAQHDTANSEVSVALNENTTEIAYGQVTIPKINGTASLLIEKRITPSGGQHTYKARLRSVGAGTATIAGHANFPAFIEVIEQ